MDDVYSLAVEVVTLGVKGTLPGVLLIGPGDMRDALALPSQEADGEAGATVLDITTDVLFYVLRTGDATFLAVAVPA